MRMRMMQMRPLVDQVDRQHQLAVGEDLERSAVADEAVVLAEHDAAVGQHVERLEVVGGQHDGLAGVVELDDQLDQPLLRAWVERRGRLVEQQDLGVHHQHRRDRDTLLLAARQLVRRAVGELGDVEHRQRVVAPARRPRRCDMPRFSGPKAISSRTVGENTWASEFWKMKPTRDRNPRLNCSSSRSSSVTFSPNAVKRAGVGKDEPVEDLEQRRLAAAVGAEQRDLLASLHGQATRRRARRSDRGTCTTRRRRRRPVQRPMARSTPMHECDDAIAQHERPMRRRSLGS